MFVAMNRFRVKAGSEDTFIELWRRRDSHLAGVPGFVRFHLLRQSHNAAQGYTLFASHSEWTSEQAFADWTRSEAFRETHVGAGRTPRDMYMGPPELECFNAVL